MSVKLSAALAPDGLFVSVGLTFGGLGAWLMN
jgi:hypothetical protein